MEKTEMVSPVYFILADGKSQNDGCVITREREKVHATVNLNQEKDQTKSGSWFLLQTNYDPDKSPPFFDDRRNPGIKVCAKSLFCRKVNVILVYEYNESEIINFKRRLIRCSFYKAKP